jgi:hypothetical protein
MDEYEQAYKEALASSPKGSLILETLEVRHETAGVFYLVNDNVPLTAKLENGEEVTFRAAGFNLTLPTKDDSGVQSLTVTLSDINREASDFVFKTVGSKKPIKMSYRPYLKDDTTKPQTKAPLVLYAREVSIKGPNIKATANFADLLNKPFLNKIYTRRLFPSLTT